jgi:parvulin-like peptidyl-prolyl isomerase
LTDLEALRARDAANDTRLAEWHVQLLALREQANRYSESGKVHLLHMILGTQELVDLVQKELAAGVEFTTLVVQFSRGAAASKGGSIGWVSPADMAAPMNETIAALAINDISPPIESKGLYHIFKRIP